MNPDDLRETWQKQSSQSRLAIDVDLLVSEVQRNQRQFSTTIFWRDVREVGTALLLVPVWWFLGVKLALPWTWYLTMPALVWVAGFMLIDRRLRVGAQPDPGEPLRKLVLSSLAQVEHQMRLLSNVLWWYVLPVTFPMLVFVGQVGLESRSGWIPMIPVASAVVAVFAGVYWLNKHYVSKELEPRRRELLDLLAKLQDEPSEPNG